MTYLNLDLWCGAVIIYMPPSNAIRLFPRWIPLNSGHHDLLLYLIFEPLICQSRWHLYGSVTTHKIWKIPWEITWHWWMRFAGFYGGTYFFGLWSVFHFDIFIVVSCLYLHICIAYVISIWQMIDGRGDVVCQWRHFRLWMGTLLLLSRFCLVFGFCRFFNNPFTLFLRYSVADICVR